MHVTSIPVGYRKQKNAHMNPLENSSYVELCFIILLDYAE